ncbi:MAG: hypothetical protein ABS83_04625 [Rhodospirillales bacterium SCN 65-16]|nr:MAG: hypothetical protein ABS83_04625 [Rhodospirillales bacterium SCN 65-16]
MLLAKTTPTAVTRRRAMPNAPIVNVRMASRPKVHATAMQPTTTVAAIAAAAVAVAGAAVVAARMAKANRATSRSKSRASMARIRR